MGVSEVGAGFGVHLGFSELVEVAQELQHVGAAAAGEGQRWTVVLEVLAEGVPVAPLLGLVPAQRRSHAHSLRR